MSLPPSVTAQISALNGAAAPVEALPLSATQALSVDAEVPYDASTDFTVELWFRASPGWPTTSLMERCVDSAGGLRQGWRLAVKEGAPRFHIAAGTSREAHDGADYAFRIELADFRKIVPAVYDGWHHIACVYRHRSHVTLWFDGHNHRIDLPLELRYTGNLVPAIGPTVIANPPRVNLPTIDIAEIRIWSEAREPEEIEVDRRRRLTGQEDGLIGNWRCDAVRDGKVPNLVAGRPEAVVLQDGRPLGAAASPGPPTASGLRLAPVDAIPPDDRQQVELWRQRVALAKQTLANRLSVYRQQRRSLGNAQRQCELLENDIARFADQVREAAASFRQGEVQVWREHREKLNDLRAGAGTRIAEVVETLSKQIQATRDTLRDQGAPYRLARVSIELRATPDGVGAGLILPTEDELRSGDAGRLSVVRAEFAAIDKARPPPDTEIPVPDVTGYTRALAERRLAEVGLQMAARYQAVAVAAVGDAAASQRVHRVISQDPTRDGKSVAGGTVTVLLGEPAARDTTTI